MATTKDVILVTGSSGLIGSAAVRRFTRDFQVVGIDVSGPAHAPPEVAFVSVDVTSDESVQNGLEGVRARHGRRIASVIHLAAYYDFSGEPSPKYDEITVRGTERLLRGLQEFDVEQFIFSSTMLVHPPCQPGERINEEWPIRPQWAYPESKAQTEHLIREQHGTIPVLILRIAGVYDNQGHLTPLVQQTRRIYERSLTSRVYPGALDHGQAVVHLDDLIDAFALAVQRRRDLPGETAVLIGEPETLSYGDLQRMVGRLLHNEEWETQEIPKPVAKAGTWLQNALPWNEDSFIKPFMIDLADDHYALDIARAQTRLGWSPQHRLRDTLPSIVQDLQADPLAWYRANKLPVPSWLTRRSA